MVTIGFTPKFFKMLKKVESDVREEAFKRLELFKNLENHKLLEVHKLHGKFFDKHGFSVTRKIRIMFQYLEKNHVVMLAIGDHDIYR